MCLDLISVICFLPFTTPSTRLSPRGSTTKSAPDLSRLDVCLFSRLSSVTTSRESFIWQNPICGACEYHQSTSESSFSSTSLACMMDDLPICVGKVNIEHGDLGGLIKRRKRKRWQNFTSITDFKLEEHFRLFEVRSGAFQR